MPRMCEQANMMSFISAHTQFPPYKYKPLQSPLVQKHFAEIQPDKYILYSPANKCLIYVFP